MKFVSEQRCYVLDGEIQAIHPYKGDPTVYPDSARILAMVRAYRSSPVAYGLDVGVLDNGDTVLVEVNDYCCLGNYGIRPAPYALAIARRWEELWRQYREE